MALLEELKRRRVIRALVGYGIASFAVLQVAEPIIHGFRWPDAVLSYLVAALALGFPVIVSLAWIFDVRAGRLERTAPSPLLGGPRLAAVLVGLGLLAAAPGSIWYFVLRGTARTVAGAPSSDRSPFSVAVLPFVDMSPGKDQEYFSDGIAEEILNVLARTPELAVAARTSSFQFKGERRDIAQIASQLKVRMVLEGSVRKQGERVRVTAQLIDAGTGFHLWSRTFDRDLKDVFAIQDEIATAIGSELKVRVGGARAEGQPELSVSGTKDVAAHDLYLRGLSLWQERSEERIWEAIDAFRQAVEKDPGYANAYAGLALAYVVVPDYSARISYSSAFDKVTDVAAMALALDPTLAEPYAALASVATQQRRRRTAAALYRRAIALQPSFATAYQWFGTALMAAGDPAAGVEFEERARALDPRSRVVGNNHALVLQGLGRLDEARAECERVLAFAPDYIYCHDQIGLIELQRGALERARPSFVRTAELLNPSALPLVGQVFEALHGRGDRRAVARRLASDPPARYLQQGSGTIFSAGDTPVLLIRLGEPTLALDYLERAAFEEGGVVEWAMVLPPLDAIRCDPRFVALAKRLDFDDVRARGRCASGAKATPP